MGNNLTYNEHRSAIIKTSWSRCESQYGLEKQNKNNIVILTENELKQHKDAVINILDGSTKVIESVRHLAKQGDYCVLVSDSDGVAIKGYADTPQSSECAAHGLVAGSTWNEEDIGTNGLGTCLASKQSITVSGGDHYASHLHNFTCVAAPIYEPSGTIIGALDISRLTNEDFVESFFTYSFIKEAANQISANLFLSQFEDQNVISLSPSSMVTIYESKALLSFNDEGAITGATQDCLQLLEVMDQSQIIGRKCEDVFPLALDDAYKSLSQPIQIKEGLFENLFIKGLRGQPGGNAERRKTVPVRRKPVASVKRGERDALSRFAGSDPAMQRIVQMGTRLINKDIPLLILGETGVGKDTFTKLLHEQSDRVGGPFVAVNCAAIPESLLDSELFGYKPGTFTDGLRDGKKGKILAANGGTLFLDEIGDMPMGMQAHLLRVLQEREVTPLGAVDPISVDVRVVCATNQNIFNLVDTGLFRQDLLFRIRGAQLEIPALRERRNIREIVEEIIVHQTDYDFDDVSFNDEVWHLFESYSWPGNIRELKSALLFALCLSEKQHVVVEDLPPEITAGVRSSSQFSGLSGDVAGVAANGYSRERQRDAHETPPAASLYHSSNMAEARHIEDLLRRNNWNVSATAEQLSISRSTLHRKIRKYDIVAPNKAT